MNNSTDQGREPASSETIPVRSLFKNIAQSSAAYTVPFIMQRVVGILMIPITTRFLTPSDYGIVDLIEQTLSVIALLLGVRFASTLGYFYFQSESPRDRQVVASTTIIGSVLIGTMAAALCWPFAEPLSRLVFGNTSAAFYFHIALTSWPVGFCMEALFSWLRVENRPGMYTLASAVRLVFGVVMILLFVVMLRLHVAGMLYSALVAGSLTAVVMLIDLFRRLRPAFDKALFIRMVKYAMPLGVGSIGAFIINVGDRFLLPHYRPMEELGVYVLAQKIGIMISFVYGSFDSYWSAQVFDIMRRDDADSIFARVFTYVVFGLSACGLGLIVFARPVLSIVSAPAFHGAAAVVPLIVLAYFIRVLGDFLRSLFLVSGRTTSDAFTTWLGSFVCIASYWLLIPRYGMWGAAITSVLAFTTISTVSAVWTYRIRPYRLETRRLIKIAIAIAAALLLWRFAPLSSLPLQFAVAVSAMAVFALSLWMMGFATPGELHNARAGLQMLMRRAGLARQVEPGSQT